MKRKLFTMLCVLAAGTVTACGASFQVSDSTVYITKKGTVIGAAIEDFNEEYYDEKELETYISESVDTYVASNGDGSVELDRFQTKSGEEGTEAQLYLNYASYIDYAQFNDVVLFAGTLEKALEEGYTFDHKFQKAQEGKLAGSLEAQEFLEEEGLKAIIIGEQIRVKIDGKVRYVSDSGAKLLAEDVVGVQYDREDENAQPTCIIYE